MKAMTQHILIVGAGHAGGAAAFELRKAGFTGEITLIGAEGYLPYQRPPLSKAYMKGESSEDDLFLRDRDWYNNSQVNLILSIRINLLNRANKGVRLSDGRVLGYDKLILATGARCRTLDLPGADLGGVLTLRDFGDAQSLKTLCQAGANLVVIGGGYIGLEAAAVARHLGCTVTLIEREDRLMARTASAEISDFYAAEHKRQGVDLRFGVRTARFTGEGRLQGVELSDGTVLKADAALIGIGVIPNVELAETVGLAVDNGIVVDEHARTSDPDVFAIGDVTSRPVGGSRLRLESVHNALEQAKLAAAAICGMPAPKCETPWFWSDQYDLKLQIVGINPDGAQRVVRGDPYSRHFAVFHLVNGAVRAVEAVNEPTAFMAGKQLISSGRAVDPAQLADEAVPLKAIMAGAVAAS